MQLWILLFLSFLTVFGAAALAWWRVAVHQGQRRIGRLLEEVDPGNAVVTTTTLPIPRQSPARRGVAALIEPEAAGETAAGGSRSRRRRLLLTACMAVAGALAGSRFQHWMGPAAPLVGTLALGAAPFLLEARRRRKREAAIEEQFPEALDFLSRSVRAGNALSISLELLARETGEPLRSEFLKVSREQALGASLEAALQNFLVRVPLVEARFFVAAILLQRETGGNLAEVLSRLGIDIRERLRLRRQVKVASGHGRLTAKILTVLPILLVAGLAVISPRYMEGLTGDPTGRSFLGGAVISQVLGYLWMNKITNIEV
jgi:tight adherence protein B